MSEDRKVEAVQLLKLAVLDREFLSITGFPGLHECQMCWAAVETSSRQLHMDWHDKVHESLEELAELLKAAR